MISYLKEQILEELNADRVFDDVTSALISTMQTGKAIVFAKVDGVFSGVKVVEAFQCIFKDKFEFNLKVEEGAFFKKGDTLIELKGEVAHALSLERTLLNFLGHACGVATLTRKFVEVAKPHKVKILATRKTLPGLRDLELNAVVAGGGYIHRRSLSDGILIKDNHIALSDIKSLIENAKAMRSPLHKIEVEVQSLKQLQEVLLLKPDVIMLDNLNADEMKQAISLIRSEGEIKIEISGGVALEKVNELAALGADFISVGRITHSAAWHDLSLDFIL